MMGSLSVTWEPMVDAGWETLVCLKVREYSSLRHKKKTSLNYNIYTGTMCPPPCHSPAPSQCADGEVVCDNGSIRGCWTGDYCMPAGENWLQRSKKIDH